MHVRCLKSLKIKSYSYSALHILIVTRTVSPQLKLVDSRNLTLELWDLSELLKLVNAKIKTKANSIILISVMNLIIWTCDLHLRWHLKSGKVFLIDVFLVWDNIDRKCDL